MDKGRNPAERERWKFIRFKVLEVARSTCVERLLNVRLIFESNKVINDDHAVRYSLCRAASSREIAQS